MQATTQTQHNNYPLEAQRKASLQSAVCNVQAKQLESKSEVTLWLSC